MADESQAAFNEVLAVTVDVPAFQEGLNQLKAAYQAWVDSLGESGAGVVGAGMFSGLQKQLEALVADNAELQASIVETVQNSAAQVEEIGTKLDSVQEQLSQKKRQRAKTDAETEVQEAEKAAQAVAKAQADAQGAALENVPKFYRDLATEQEGAVQAEIDRQAELKARQLQLAEDINLEQQALQDQYDAKVEADAEKRAARQKALAEEIALEQQALEDKYAAQVEADLEKRAAMAKKLAEEIAFEQQALEDQYAAKVEAQLEKEAVAREALWERQKALAEEIALEQQGLEDEYNARMEAEAERRAARQKALAEEIALEQEGILNAYNEKVNKANEGTPFMDSMLAKTIQAYAVWVALSTVIEGVVALLKSPFVALESGVTYLQQVEVEADKLAGVINMNVGYSHDLVENFKMSRDAAHDVVLELQDLSAKIGIPFQSLQRTFEAIVSSGGAATVKTTRDLVQLAGMLDLAMQASGRSSESMRSIVSQLPQLFNGTLKNTSALAEALHMSGAELQKMVSSAKEHGDLVQQLEAKMKPYLDEVAQAQMHHEAMVNALELQKQRIEGIVATPIYEAIDNTLKQILDWAEKNRDLIQQWAQWFAKLIEYCLQLGSELTKVGNVLNSSVVKGFLAANIMLVSMLSNALRLLSTVGDIGTIITSGWDVDKRNKAFVDMAKTLLDIKNNASDTQKLIADLDKIGEGNGSEQGPSSLDKGIFNKANNPSLLPTGKDQNAEWQRQKEQFLSDVDQVKQHFEDLTNGIKASVAAQKLSHADAAKSIQTYSAAEISAIDTLYQQLLSKAATFRQSIVAENSKTAESATAAGANFDKQLISLQDRVQKTYAASNKSVVEAQTQAGAEQARIAQLASQSLIQIAQDRVAKEEAIAKAQYQNGELTTAQYYEKQASLAAQAHAIELDQIDKEMAGVARGTVKYQELLDQRNRLDSKYTETARQLSQARLAADEQELTKRQAYFASLAQENIKQATLLSSLDKVQNPKEGVDQELYSLREQELAQLTKETALHLQLALAKNQESDATKKLIVQLEDLLNQRLALVNSKVQDIQQKYASQPFLAQQLAYSAQNDYANQLRAQYLNAQNNVSTFYQNNPGKLDSNQVKQLDVLNKIVVELGGSLGKLEIQMEQAAPSFEKALNQMVNKLVGFDFQQAWDTAKTTIGKFTVAASAASGVLANLPGIVSSIENGINKGGALGGIGAGLSAFSGPLSQGIAKLAGVSGPLVGSIIGAVSGVFSLIGGLFQQEAQHIADQIKKSFDLTVQAYQNGDSTLVATIQQVEQERQQAITELSGKKGGKDQLDKLLPTIDQELDQLKQKQQQIISDFDNGLNNLILQSDTLSQINQQWQQINKTVKDYIDAGGDAIKAQQYLSLQLQQMQADAQNQLDQANQQAIEDAINLNDLLTQRNQLTQDYQNQLFQLENADSIERRQAGAVTRAQQIKDAQTQYQQQLDALNQQISLTQQKVDKESQVFTISTSIADLHRQDEQLTLAALDQQIQKWKDLQTIVAGISVGANGVYSAAPGLFNSPSALQINVTVTPSSGSDPTQVGTEIANTVASELARLSRMSPTS